MEMVDTYKLQIDELRKMIRSTKRFDEAMAFALDLHAITHMSVVSSSVQPTFCEIILNGLNDEAYRIMPTAKDETIAWHLWHIARIEDLVGNVLIANQAQIFNDDLMKRMHVHVKDTGNAMNDEQIMQFSNEVNIQELIQYRNAVGMQTRNILMSLSAKDLKQKPQADSLLRLVQEGGLLECKKSFWLKDFWGKRSIAGLITLPLTGHHMMHLPDSLAIKNFVKS